VWIISVISASRFCDAVTPPVTLAVTGTGSEALCALYEPFSCEGAGEGGGAGDGR
jgi:hypothetical protein